MDTPRVTFVALVSSLFTAAGCSSVTSRVAPDGPALADSAAARDAAGPAPDAAAPDGGAGLLAGRLAIHSFVFAGYTTGAKTYLFDAALRTGKTLIRYDFAMSAIEPDDGVFTWAKPDENVAMSRARGLAILGTIGGTAPWIATQAAYPYRGPVDADKYDRWAELIEAIVHRYPDILYWEIWNEPDLPGSFGGTAADYARTLSVSYAAVKRANPEATVLLGGVTSRALGNGWLLAVAEDPSYPGASSFDVANIHLRGPVAEVLAPLEAFRRGLDAGGRADAPIWITEHGYAADPQYQSDPNYRGTDLASGEQAQADYYRASLPALVDAGAARVFVTLRDMTVDQTRGRPSPFLTEGLVTFLHDTDTSGRDRPSMGVFQSL